MPVFQHDRRAQRQPRTLRTAVPPAVSARGRHERLPALHARSDAHRPPAAAARRGRVFLQARGTHEAAGVRRRRHAGVSRGARRRAGARAVSSERSDAGPAPADLQPRRLHRGLCDGQKQRRADELGASEPLGHPRGAHHEPARPTGEGPPDGGPARRRRLAGARARRDRPDVFRQRDAPGRRGDGAHARCRSKHRRCGVPADRRRTNEGDPRGDGPRGRADSRRGGADCPTG